jgi:very-short-patch-repair endonuclease
VDFVCFEAGLVVEIDGGQHATVRFAADRRGDAEFNVSGFRVLRIWNADVVKNLDGVLEHIAAELAEHRAAPHPPASRAPPSPDGRGKL